MENTERDDGGLWSLLIGSTLTLVGATTVFAQLQGALNQIFEVKAKPSSAVSAFIRARLISLGVVLGLGFLMLVSLLASAALSGAQAYAAASFDDVGWFWSGLNIVLAFMVLTGFMAMLFKYVPDVSLAWRDTWIGAGTTALLFTLGKYAIGVYLGTASVGSAFGAAGSAVVFMVWIYYASLILFIGAEITSAIADDLHPAAFARCDHGAGTQDASTLHEGQ
jgi:membrane protein